MNSSTSPKDRKTFEGCLSFVADLAEEWADTDPKPNTKLPKLSHNDSDDNLPKYSWNQVKLVKEIGNGVECEVYTGLLGDEDEEGEEVAVKVLHSKTKVEEAAQLWKNFVPHPNVAMLRGLIQLDSANPHCGLIMDYHPPGALQDFKFSPNAEVCLDLFRGIAQGLSHLHRQNILHQDLARRNILLTRASGVVLTDFGLSVRLEDSNFSRTVSSNKERPLEMLAPEVCKALLEKKKIKTSSRRDMWAFGVIMWEIVTHKPYIPRELNPKYHGVEVEQLYRAILNDSLLPLRDVVLKVGFAEPRIVVALIGCKQPKEQRLTAEEARLVLGGAPWTPEDDHLPDYNNNNNRQIG